MEFNSIINQETIKSRLRQYVKGGRLPQSLLLLGPEGCGKLGLALAFAAYIQCENPGDWDVCGQCSSCRNNKQFTHPDLHFSFPTVKLKEHKEPPVSNDFLRMWRAFLKRSPYFSLNEWLEYIGAEGKQANITKRECVQITSKLSLKAYTSNYKILLMWLPEYLGNEGNRLLKLIEEPPDKTVFILVAERPERILPTILSRCQIQYVPSLQEEDVAQGLRQLAGIGGSEAEQVARLAGGNLTEALKLAQVMDQAVVTEFNNWLRICFRPSNSTLIQWVTEFSRNGREEQKNFLRYGLHLCREVLAHSQGGQEWRLGKDEIKTATGMASVFSPGKLVRMAEMFTENSYFIERNANADLLFLKLSLDLISLMNKKDG